MSEPATATAGGIALYKLGAFGSFAALAAIVVMAMTLPKTGKEFGLMLICTLVGSFGGGSFIVRWFDIGHWINDDFGVMAIGGVLFCCGLPAWLTVRAYFKYAEMRKDKTIIEIIGEIKAAIRG